MIDSCHRPHWTFPDDAQCPKEPGKLVICSDLWYCLHFLGIMPRFPCQGMGAAVCLGQSRELSVSVCLKSFNEHQQVFVMQSFNPGDGQENHQCSLH